MAETQDIVLAAINSAGPQGEDVAAWRARVIDNAGAIAAMLDKNSEVVRVIESVSRSAVFSGVIRKVTKEKTSTRGLVDVYTGSTAESAVDGVETLRTERTDSETGRRMALLLKSLIGHRVLIWKDVQTMANSTTKVRIISHVEDLGVENTDSE